MYTNSEAKFIAQNNNKRVKELIWISWTMGINLTKPTLRKDALRIINVLFVLFSTLSLYGNWSLFVRYISDIPQIGETLCTALQVVISVCKMVYFLFTQKRFYCLLETALTHEILQKIEIFQKDTAIKSKLKHEIHIIMEATWQNIRRQLVFFCVVCIAVMCSYIFKAVGINTYHQLKQTPNYKHILPIPAVYPIWEDKGMSFPYYHMQLFLSGCASYIAGLSAVSFDGLFIVLCMHGVGLIEVLNLLTKHATSPLVPREERVAYLRSCIRHYIRTWDYILELKQIYQHIVLFQFLPSLVLIGVVIFQLNLSMETDRLAFIRMVFFIIGACYEVLLYCLNGQRLTSAYDDIPLSLYECAWYDESKEFKTLLKMMILRTNREFELKISWFAVMSLPTFMALIKASGSYFLLLQDLSE